jgi:Domain of unknown function (DUF4868)
MTINVSEPEALLKYILTLDLATCTITVCIAAGETNSKDFEFRRIHQSENLAQQFREAIARGLEAYRKKLDERDIELCEFAADTTKQEQEVEYLNLLPYDSIKNQVKAVENYLDFGYFEHQEQSFINRMRFYILHIKPPTGSPIYFYRNYSPSQMLSRSPFFAARLQQDFYDNLVEPTFLFDRHIDCFSLEEHMFILQKNNFFKIFEIGELKKVAQETLDRLEKKDLISNFQRFKKDCLADKIKILKLKNISTKTYLDTLTIDDLHKTIQHYNLPIQVDLVANGNKRLAYDGRDRWAILHLLDDAYADSRMTRSSYYLKGKREIQRNP